MTVQLMPDRLAQPPPLEMDLIDADRVVGWIVGDTVGFQGFGDETEAAHAAWVAHGTLARRLARGRGTPEVPVDTEWLALRRSSAGDAEVILASGRPIARLIRAGSDSRAGDSFGFELTVPPPATELQFGVAYLIYRALRQSGVRWGMWLPAVQVACAARTAQVAEATSPGSTWRTVTVRPDAGAVIDLREAQMPVPMSR